MFSTARSPRRVLVPVVAVLAAALTLSGCAAGQISQTANQVAAIDGANGTVGRISVLNALLATPSGSDYAKGADVPLQVWVSNAGVGTDTLTTITTPAASSVQISGTATIPGQSLADFSGTKVKLTLKTLTANLTYGKSVPVTFAFTSAGTVTINVPVEIPPERTSGRPGVDIQPSKEGSLWESAAPSSAAG